MALQTAKWTIKYEPADVGGMLEVVFVRLRGQKDKIGRELDLCPQMVAIASKYLTGKKKVWDEAQDKDYERGEAICRMCDDVMAALNVDETSSSSLNSPDWRRFLSLRYFLWQSPPVIKAELGFSATTTRPYQNIRMRAYNMVLGELSKKLSTMDQATMDQERGPEYKALLEAQDEIVAVLAGLEGPPTNHLVKIIATTGTHVLSLVDYYLANRTNAIANMDVKILLINPDPRLTFLKDSAPHWPAECLVQALRIEEVNERLSILGSDTRIAYSFYDYMPCLQGMYVDDFYLRIGFCQWILRGNKIRLDSAAQPFPTYEKEKLKDESEKSLFNYLTKVFDNWFDSSWSFMGPDRSRELVHTLSDIRS